MYVHKLNLKKTKFMNKMIMNRLTMLAVTLMASIACFAQGKMATTIESGKQVGDVFDYLELKYKVTNASAGYTVQVIGFADAFEADPTKFDTSEDIDAFNTVTIPHYIGTSTDVAVQVYVQSIADGALNTSDATLAGKVTAITIQYVDNDKTQGIPVSIGENAFAGLTSVATVKSFTPSAKVAAIPESSFAKVVYQTATLIVPESTNYATVKAYAKTDGWSKFYKKSDGAIILGDVTGEGSINVFDVNRIKKMIAHTMDVNTVADFDGSGAVNVFDVNRLKKVIAKTY